MKNFEGTPTTTPIYGKQDIGSEAPLLSQHIMHMSSICSTQTFRYAKGRVERREIMAQNTEQGREENNMTVTVPKSV